MPSRSESARMKKGKQLGGGLMLFGTIIFIVVIILIIKNPKSNSSSMKDQFDTGNVVCLKQKKYCGPQTVPWKTYNSSPPQCGCRRY